LKSDIGNIGVEDYPTENPPFVKLVNLGELFLLLFISGEFSVLKNICIEDSTRYTKGRST
jgi:hypothetical protein